MGFIVFATLAGMYFMGLRRAVVKRAKPREKGAPRAL